MNDKVYLLNYNKWCKNFQKDYFLPHKDRFEKNQRFYLFHFLRKEAYNMHQKDENYIFTQLFKIYSYLKVAFNLNLKDEEIEKDIQKIIEFVKTKYKKGEAYERAVRRNRKVAKMKAVKSLNKILNWIFDSAFPLNRLKQLQRTPYLFIEQIGVSVATIYKYISLLGALLRSKFFEILEKKKDLKKYIKSENFVQFLKDVKLKMIMLKWKYIHQFSIKQIVEELFGLRYISFFEFRRAL